MGDRGRTATLAGTLAGVVLLSGCSASTTADPGSADGTASPSTSDRGTPSGGSSSGASSRDRSSDRPDDGPLRPALDGEPAVPTSPRQAVAQIEAADRVVRDRDASPELLTAAAHTQQLAYRTVAERPRWDRRVEAALPRVLRRETRANVGARREFRSMHGELATELPAWRIVAPRPARELLRHYREAERRSGVDWEYLAAINLVETGFGRIDGDSVAGAQGPMQFIPTTWDIYGEGGDVRDPRDAILAAGRLLQANGFRRDPAAALYRYNNSTAYVRGVTAYAEVMRQRPRTFLAYHQWPVYYLTRFGSVWLPEGYDEQRPVPVRKYLARRG